MYFKHEPSFLRKCSTSKRSAFTLVEIMVVLVIIGLLATAVTVNVRGYMASGYQNTVKMEMRAAMDAVETFHAMTGRYPTNEEGLAILSQSSEQFAEPLLSRTPIDPWGKPYEYIAPGQDHPFEINCYGADGRPGGKGSDADLNCWSARKDT
ncbi:type II secretion system major pseudopilin GspG [bacterium]|nr:type II secretion system major pseudopilin GspG [bacterium]